MWFIWAEQVKASFAFCPGLWAAQYVMIQRRSEVIKSGGGPDF